MSSYEKAWYNYLKGLYSSNAEQAFENNNMRKEYPKDFIINHENANFALYAFSNPELALEIYSELPIEKVDAAPEGIYYNFKLCKLF